MNSNEGKWIWSTNDEIFRTNDFFDTIAEAIADAREQEDEGEVIYVGQVFDPITAAHVDVDNVLEIISEQIYSEVGEVAEDYLNDVKQEDFSVLEERLNTVLMDWMKEFGYEPKFYKVDNIIGVEL